MLYLVIFGKSRGHETLTWQASVTALHYSSRTGTYLFSRKQFSSLCFLLLPLQWAWQRGSQQYLHWGMAASSPTENSQSYEASQEKETHRLLPWVNSHPSTHSISSITRLLLKEKLQVTKGKRPNCSFLKLPALRDFRASVHKGISKTYYWNPQVINIHSKKMHIWIQSLLISPC